MGKPIYRESEDRMLALTDARKKANEKYIQNNYKQVKLSMPKAEAETLDEYCKAKGLTKAGFIRQAIKEKMEREP
nr:RepB family protein [Mediterraneibacter faecis]